MSRRDAARIRQLVLLIGTQVVCVAVGLWVCHGLATASLEEHVEGEVREELAAAARRLSAVIEQKPSCEIADQNTASDILREACDSVRPLGSDMSVALTAADGRVVGICGRQDGSSECALSKGDLVPWTARVGPAEEDPDPRAGVLNLPSGAQVAASFPLEGGRTSLLLFRPAAQIAVRAAALGEPLPAIGLLTLLWIGTMMSISFILLTNRRRSRHEQAPGRTGADDLRQSHTVIRTRNAIIFGLAKLAESRDRDTGDHLERLSIYTTILARAARQHPRYAKLISASFVRNIGLSAALHDIGKVGVEDGILLKPGPLTPEERGRMQAHTTIGGKCLREIEQRLGRSNFLQMAREIALAHHERWDGAGYPHGLVGAAIPLSARITAIADVYDALSSKRVYKNPIAHDVCVDQIRGNAGTQFDPGLTEVWLGVHEKFREVARRLGGGPSDFVACEMKLDDDLDDAALERQLGEEAILATPADAIPQRTAR